ncbi:MAG: GNAT family N-acetyltransferase [Clostridia bacterium]|nr:GNAT family N-acetyltransferase [Clostridia bacterium]
MNIKIREGTIEDLDKGLLNAFIEGYRFHQNGRPDIFANLSDETLKEDLIKNVQTLSTLVILDNESIVGYVAYEIKEKHSKKLHVDQLVIAEEYRGLGLGKKLMNKVKEIGIKNNCDRIELDCWMFNTNALAMYEHIGFERQRIMYEMKL